MVFQETSLVPSMTVAQNLYLGKEKVAQPPARHLHLGPAIPAVAEFHRRSDGDRRDARRRQAADGRDRARRPPQCRGHHLRRADGDADAGGEAPLLRADAAAEAHAASRSSSSATRWRRRSPMPTASPSCATASWSRPAKASAFDREKVDPRHGRPRAVRARSTIARRSADQIRKPGAKVLSVQDISMGNGGAQHIPSRSSRARSPACSA